MADILKKLETVTNIISSLSKKMDEKKFEMELNECLSEIYDAKKECLKLQDENSDLKKQLETKKDIEYENGYITRKSDEKKIKYCPVCWGKSGILIPMQDYENGYFKCCICGSFCDTRKKDLTQNNVIKEKFIPY